MACDEGLVERIRSELQGTIGISEKRMFGGVCFTLNGNMVLGVVKDELMVRLDEAAYANALRQPHVREMDFTGRPMKGYVFVASAGLAEDVDLRRWAALGRAFVGALPPKSPKRPPAKPIKART
jgi:TfoX/Sxy family transcriptional regulator of competence genes